MNKPNPSQVSEYSYIHLHNRLLDRETPNCAGPQIKIQTNLNIPLWEELLEGDRDHQLIYFLKYGFPLDMPYSPAFEPNTSVSNHSTAKQFPASIQEYLKTEITHRAIMGPYSNPPMLPCSHALPCPHAQTRVLTAVGSLSTLVGLMANR